MDDVSLIVKGAVDAAAFGSLTSNRPVESAGADLRPAVHHGAVQVSVTIAPGASIPQSVTGTPRWMTMEEDQVDGSVRATADGHSAAVSSSCRSVLDAAAEAMARAIRRRLLLILLGR